MHKKLNKPGHANKNPTIGPCVHWPSPAVPSHIVQIASVLELWPTIGKLRDQDGLGKLTSGVSGVKS